MGVLFRKALAGTGGKTLVMNEVNDRRFCANEMSTEANSPAGRSRGPELGFDYEAKPNKQIPTEGNAQLPISLIDKMTTMKNKPSKNFLLTLSIISLFANAQTTLAGKVLSYDPERGIIMIDSTGKADEPKKATPIISEKEANKKALSTPVIATPKPAETKTAISRVKSVAELHPQRKEDPATTYFKSAMDYMGNANYVDALKNFAAAVAKDTSPLYLFREGQCALKAGDTAQMLSAFATVTTAHSHSDVADDAMFQLGVFNRNIGDFHAADSLFARLEDEYPFGVSIETGDEFREQAASIRRSMRDSLMSMLKDLGAIGVDLQEMCTDFQKSHDIPQSGNADAATVKLAMKLLKDKSNPALHSSHKSVQQSSMMLILPLAFFFVMLILAIVMRFFVLAKKREVDALSRQLEELSTGEFS